MATQQNCSDSLNVLSVVWYKVLPARYGGQKGTALFNEHVGKLVKLICLCSSSNEGFSQSYKIDNSLPTSKSQFLDPFCWRKIFITAQRLKANYLILEFPYYGIAGIICKHWLGLKLIIHSHNIEYLRFRQQKKWWWRLLYLLEKKTLQSADLVFFKTESDRTNAINLLQVRREKTILLPYCIEKQMESDRHVAKDIIQHRYGLSSGIKILLFAGTLDYEPNANAVQNIYQRLLPLLNQLDLNYIVIVCGRIVYSEFEYLKELTNDRMIYAGNVEEIDYYFAAADAFLNPVISGGGVQTKIIDALSFHLNVVCFRSAMEAIEDADEKLFTAPDGDWEQFAQQTAEALKESLPTPAHFFDRYNWDKIAKKAVDALQSA